MKIKQRTKQSYIDEQINNALDSGDIVLYHELKEEYWIQELFELEEEKQEGMLNSPI